MRSKAKVAEQLATKKAKLLQNIAEVQAEAVAAKEAARGANRKEAEVWQQRRCLFEKTQQQQQQQQQQHDQGV